jgi:hypothetical protein
MNKKEWKIDVSKVYFSISNDGVVWHDVGYTQMGMDVAKGVDKSFSYLLQDGVMQYPNAVWDEDEMLEMVGLEIAESE